LAVTGVSAESRDITPMSCIGQEVKSSRLARAERQHKHTERSLPLTVAMVMSPQNVLYREYLSRVTYFILCLVYDDVALVSLITSYSAGAVGASASWSELSCLRCLTQPKAINSIRQLTAGQLSRLCYDTKPSMTSSCLTLHRIKMKIQITAHIGISAALTCLNGTSCICA